MDTPTITIIPSGSDPAETLQITVTVPSVQSLFTGSLNDLKSRMTAREEQIASIQAEQATDQSLLDEINQTFADAGVSDVSAPLTDDLAAAVSRQVSEADSPNV